MPKPRVEIEGPDGLRAIEPTAIEVRAAAPALSAFYNEAHNRAMLDHDEDMSDADVMQSYEEGDLDFLLYAGDRLVGDADFRSFEDDSAEFAILIGARDLQGKGLGRHFSIMLHAFAFRRLGLRRVYVTILATNTPSIRLFERLGYRDDQSARARDLVDHDSDVTLSMDREAFERIHGAAMDQVRIRERGAAGAC
jgi:RimJ/RimL family protein N-acetyltransferase